jgi:hypothetical protein
MAKFLPDATLDAELDYIVGSDYMVVCSAQPTTYTEAYVTYMLAKVAMAGGDFVKADDTSGRKLTVAAKNGITIAGSGNATHIALVKVSDTTLRAVTTCTTQTLTAGGTVDVPSFKINPQDPT